MKARGQLRVTEEKMRQLLQLPEDVVITDVKYDSDRDIISYLIRSENPIDGLAFVVPEGAEAPVSDDVLK